MVYNISTELFSTNFNNVTVAGVDIIIPLALIFICVIVITRDVTKWMKLGLPVAVALTIAGVRIPLTVGMGLFAMYAVSALGNDVIGRVIKGSYNTTARGMRSVGLINRNPLRKQIKRENILNPITKTRRQKMEDQYIQLVKEGTKPKKAMDLVFGKEKSRLDIKEKVKEKKKETEVIRNSQLTDKIDGAVRGLLIAKDRGGTTKLWEKEIKRLSKNMGKNKRNKLLEELNIKIKEDEI